MLKKKLNRLKPHLTGSGKDKSEKKTIEVTSTIPYLELWEKEQVVPYYFDNDYCLIREITYPLSYRYGRYQFKELFSVVKAWNDTRTDHPLSAIGHKAGDLFFFDTETTGLGGGTGNTIFLLGHASVSNSAVTVKQHILPHPGAEVPLLSKLYRKCRLQDACYL